MAAEPEIDGWAGLAMGCALSSIVPAVFSLGGVISPAWPLALDAAAVLSGYAALRRIRSRKATGGRLEAWLGVCLGIVIAAFVSYISIKIRLSPPEPA